MRTENGDNRGRPGGRGGRRPTRSACARALLLEASDPEGEDAHGGGGRDAQELQIIAMYTVAQVAELLGVSRSLVYTLCAAGLIRHSRHGRPGRRGCIRIDEAALEEYRQSCKGEGRHPAAPPDLQHIRLS